MNLKVVLSIGIVGIICLCTVAAVFLTYCLFRCWRRRQKAKRRQMRNEGNGENIEMRRRERRRRRGRRDRSGTENENGNENENENEEDIDYPPSYDELMMSEGERVTLDRVSVVPPEQLLAQFGVQSEMNRSRNEQIPQISSERRDENRNEVEISEMDEEELALARRRNQLELEEDENENENENVDSTQEQPLLNQRKKKKKVNRKNTEDSLSSVASNSTQASSSNQQNQEDEGDGSPLSPFTTVRMKKKSKLQESSKKFKCLAKKEFVALRDTELTIRPGDLITVTNVSMDEQGWWEGKLNGKTGLFPCSNEYIQVVKTKKKSSIAS